MQTVLSVRSLSFCYPEYSSLKNRKLYESLTFSIEEGEIALFLAPPESGKTTLSRLISSLVPRYTGGELGGEIFVSGINVQEEKPYNLNEMVGIVFQDPEEQILTPMVESEIAFSLESSGFDHSYIEKKVEDAIDFMQIDMLREKNPALLSGGEKRKLLLACLAASGPQLWILDETLEEIDPSARKNILDKLKKSGKTVLILTSKMLDIYSNYCSRFFLFNGKELYSETGMPGAGFMEKAVESGVFLKHENMSFPQMNYASGSVSSGDILLKAEDIIFAYPDSDFSLEIKEFEMKNREVVALLGHNGSGKSTFAKIIAGLLSPSSGTVSLKNGGGFTELNSRGKNMNVAYLFQNPDYQLFLPTVGDELSFGLKSQKIGKGEIAEKTAAASDLFRLEHSEVPPALMSYGARKRLQAAIYYLLEKKIIIIDEADSGLSFDDYSLILDRLNSSENPHSILIITHDIKLSAKIADRIIIMKKGRMIEEGVEDEFEKLVKLTF